MPTASYYHEGPTAPIPQDLPRYAHRMKVEAGIRKTGPWVVCLSGLTEAPAENNPFFLDRQGHLSIFHEKLGLIVTGANSKRQPELATFEEKTKNGLAHLPFNGRLRMSDDGDRLGLGYDTFFAEVTVPTPSESRLTFRWLVTETGRGRLKEARCHLQIRLQAGKVLETAKLKMVLEEKRIEWDPDQLGDGIRHSGWS